MSALIAARVPEREVMRTMLVIAAWIVASVVAVAVIVLLVADRPFHSRFERLQRPSSPQSVRSRGAERLNGNLTATRFTSGSSSAPRPGALEADAFQTTACSWLSVFTLAGVGLNAMLGWWWADPVAALGMTATSRLPAVTGSGRVQPWTARPRLQRRDRHGVQPCSVAGTATR